jgi:hypothetical protein
MGREVAVRGAGERIGGEAGVMGEEIAVIAAAAPYGCLVPHTRVCVRVCVCVHVRPSERADGCIVKCLNR